MESCRHINRLNHSELFMFLDESNWIQNSLSNNMMIESNYILWAMGEKVIHTEEDSSHVSLWVSSFFWGFRDVCWVLLFSRQAICQKAWSSIWLHFSFRIKVDPLYNDFRLNQNKAINTKRGEKKYHFCYKGYVLYLTQNMPTIFLGTCSSIQTNNPKLPTLKLFARMIKLWKDSSCLPFS